MSSGVSDTSTKVPETFFGHVEAWGGNIVSTIFFILWFV